MDIINQNENNLMKILQAAEKYEREQEAYADQLAEKLSAEPFFCLKDQQQCKGAFIGPSARQSADGKAYQMSVFDKHGFITHKTGNSLQVLLREAVKTHHMMLHDNDFLNQTAEKTAFHRTNARFWYHNNGKDDSILCQVDIDATPKGGVPGDDPLLVEYINAYQEAMQEKKLYAVPGVPLDISASARKELTQEALSILAEKNMLTPDSRGEMVWILQQQDPFYVHASESVCQTLIGHIEKERLAQPEISAAEPEKKKEYEPSR